MSGRAESPHPAALGVVWKIGAALAMPALAAALLVWRNDSLQDSQIRELKVKMDAMGAAMAAHADADSKRVEAVADRERDAAVAQARIAAALDAVKGQVDALLTLLSRRRPG